MLFELKASSRILLEAFPGQALFAARSEINFYLQAGGGRAIKSKQREMQTETASEMFGKCTARCPLREENFPGKKSHTEGSED